MHRSRIALSITSSLIISACLAAEDGDRPDQLLRSWEYDHPAREDARAAFSCDFEGDPAVPMKSIPAMIEQDRMHMADQPGMLHKHIPLHIDFATGQLFGGGRYLFERKHDALDYAQWVTEDYVLDGVQFLERPDIIGSDCHVWQTIGAYDFGDIGTDHVVMRTERWSVPSPDDHKAFLRAQLPDLVDDAQEAGLTGIWLLYDRDEQLVEIVYYDDRVAEPPAPWALDFPSLAALAAMPSLGGALDDAGWPKVMDRTSFVLNIWFPFELGDEGTPSVWPNSPPMPGPYCADGVCVPSRGEDSVSCGIDCTPNCGDGDCDPDEDPLACPSDCRLR